jgi:hypothetical protein
MTDCAISQLSSHLLLRPFRTVRAAIAFYFLPRFLARWSLGGPSEHPRPARGGRRL